MAVKKLKDDDGKTYEVEIPDDDDGDDDDDDGDYLDESELRKLYDKWHEEKQAQSQSSTPPKSDDKWKPKGKAIRVRSTQPPAPPNRNPRRLRLR